MKAFFCRSFAAFCCGRLGFDSSPYGRAAIVNLTQLYLRSTAVHLDDGLQKAYVQNAFLASPIPAYEVLPYFLFFNTDLLPSLTMNVSFYKKKKTASYMYM